MSVGDIMNTVGVFSTPGDNMMSVGGYHEYTGGCSVHWGFHTNSTVLSMTFPTFIMISPKCINDIPQGTEHCQYTHDIAPLYSWYTPGVLTSLVVLHRHYAEWSSVPVVSLTVFCIYNHGKNIHRLFKNNNKFLKTSKHLPPPPPPPLCQEQCWQDQARFSRPASIV